ncbi:MAG: caspase family protein [Planctomycetia bacterium]|nr:caspase family protein [Planctomycetia bacterium]
MKNSIATWLAVGVCCVALSPLAAQDRRDRTEPGLIVETGARLGACDAIRFTPDGRSLLAVGDDKVVRVWQFSERGLEPAAVPALRWAMWREQRGAIYAMALSPDGKSVAVAGLGVRTGSIAVLNRETGDIEHALIDVKGNDQTIWSLGYAPSGKQLAAGTADGSVWLWDLNGKLNGNFRKLGQHGGAAGVSNRVRLVEFTGANQLLSVAKDGTVLRWDATKGASTSVGKLKSPNVSAAALSTDRKWLAAAGEDNFVELFNLDTRTGKQLPLPEGHYPNSLAFDTRSERMAVGTRARDQKASFSKELDGLLQIYDLKAANPQPGPTIRTSEYAEAIAFHPGGRYLAVADDPDHEMKVYAVDGTRIGATVGPTMRSPGSCLWSVALSKDGQLGFRSQKAADPRHPNERGAGAWQVFNLRKRGWGSPAGFQPVDALDSLGGWQVQPDRKDAYLWYAVGPDKKQHALPLDSARDGAPRCYTFLNPKAAGKPVRLAVGHYWGVSIFELTAQGAKRVRLFTGHTGAVLSVAPSADHKLLVSASKDQTIACWSLADWANEPELGVSFELQGGKLVAKAVIAGSPGWEAGLNPGDEVTLLAFNGKPVEGGAGKWLERLQQPVPGRELYFRLRRAGAAQPVDLLTTVRQRPVWRFYPTRDREWVIWRQRDYYYDTSTNGDFAIGWQVNGKDIDEKPAFYRAEQFRNRFHQPRKIADALDGTVNDPEKIALVKIEPPDVKVQVSAREVRDEAITLNITVTPHGDEPAQQADEVLLWVNDYLLQTWKANNGTFQQKVVVPADKLRSGANLLTVQCYGKSGNRGEVNPPIAIKNHRPPTQAALHGLFAGVGDYKSVKFNDLNANKDMGPLKRVWEAQKGALYKDVDIQVLLDKAVTKAALLERCEKLASQVKPDDLLVLMLGGHGTDHEELSEVLRERKVKPIEHLPRDGFVYVCSNFDIARPLSTGLTTADLYRAMTRLPCRKVILLDACRSGTIIANPVRNLTHDGVGPIILAASQPGEAAKEDEAGRSSAAGTVYGLFSLAVVHALGEQFAKADRNSDAGLIPNELFEFVKGEVYPQQDPTRFLPALERDRVLARKR